MRKLFFIWFVLLFFLIPTNGQILNSDSLKAKLIYAKEDTNRVHLLWRLSYVYAWSHPDTGIVYAQESISLSKSLEFESGEAIANGAMGYCLITLGNYPLALDYFYKSLTYYEKIKFARGIAGTYGGLALTYRDLGDYQNALIYIRKALSLADPGITNYDLLGNASSVYAKNNQPDSAIFFARLALQPDYESSGILFVLGDSYYRLKKSDSAMYYFNRGIDRALVNHTEIDLVDLYHGKAQIYELNGQLDSAITYARKAMLEPFGKYYPRGVLNAITTLSDLYELKDQPDSTLKYLRAANTLRDSLFNREKTMAIQNLAFKEQEKKKEIEASRLKYQNRLKMYALLGGLVSLMVIAVILLRNNRRRQKAFALLQKQKQEIDIQKAKAEKTLDELKTTQAQLIQSEKMASLGELTAGIAHEIQNPLNFVNNFSDVNRELVDELKTGLATGNMQLANEIADDIKANEEKINHHGKRADSIVKGMLQHSRSSTGQKEPTDINTLADEYLRLAYHGLRAKDNSFNANIKTDFDNNIGSVNVVPQEIGRVILNLINNAFYAVDEKQKQRLNGYEPTVTLTTKKEKDKIEIKVKDNGNGIPQKVLGKIFQPFLTTRPTGQGTGLGLSLSYDIVKTHKGEIKVNTKEKEGAEFTIVLPA